MGYLQKFFTFNSSRQRLWEENAAFAKMLPNDALVLDAGSGSAPYRPLFKHVRYETADFENVDKAYEPSTYVCDLKEIPVEDNRFDFIVFNQVMEHLPDPKLVLTELNRVLKPDGKMIYTGPLFFEEHEQPYDYFRYTQFGLRHLFSVTGFEIERLDWLEGYFGTVGYQLNCMSRYLPIKAKDFGNGILGHSLVLLMLVLKAVFGVCSVLFHKLEMRTKYKTNGYPKNYLAIVRKIVRAPQKA